MVQKRGTQRSTMFGKFGGSLNTIYLFGCLRETLIVSKVSGGVFVSSDLKLLATMMGPIVSLRTCSLRSMAVLLSRAQERRSREIRARSARERAPPQSPRGFSALARLYYLALPTKTAMLRRLENME